jgi:hypothetical protein
VFLLGAACGQHGGVLHGVSPYVVDDQGLAG